MSKLELLKNSLTDVLVKYIDSFIRFTNCGKMYSKVSDDTENGYLLYQSSIDFTRIKFSKKKSMFPANNLDSIASLSNE